MIQYNLDPSGPHQPPLKIVHCFRSPVGGIFRHVRDLVEEQLAAGHEVGVICDNNTGGAFEEGFFAELKPQLALGLHRLFMHRSIAPGDFTAARRVTSIIGQIRPDVVHSHGAKGGAYSRIAIGTLRRRGETVASLYCPHGGSMHYDPKGMKGRLFFALERFLQRWTNSLVFVSQYEQRNYEAYVGPPECAQALVYNGLHETEFQPVIMNSDAAEFLYIGMMRDLKGVDLFLDALEAIAEQTGREISAHLVGDGPDLERYKERASTLGPKVKTQFHDPMPARKAFGLARTVIVPSRAESMPYIVLELIAAQKAIVATNVGGISEIFGKRSSELVAGDNLAALTDGMLKSLTEPPSDKELQNFSDELKEKFSVAVMGRTMEQAYRKALDSTNS